ncbi:MAG: AAA domain-containing protein [bacterium]
MAKFTVRSDPDGASVRPELDMLDIDEQPARAEETARDALTAAGDDPWDRTCIEGVLETLVHSISPEGEYEDTLEAKGVQASAKPIVQYAPAIILRKRSTKGLDSALRRIRERISQGEEVTPEFRDLAEIPQTHEAESSVDPGNLNAESSGEVFFPKPSNEEQRRIVDKVQSASGVLVQGPPGTGKSHTIANLICHLLATGQRILVTAKTPRALQVLENLLPDEMRPLCINLLGSGLEEKRSLETSVGGILYKNEEWNEQLSSAELHSLGRKLGQLREDKAVIERRLRAIRESETHTHTISEGIYRGTAARITRDVKAQERQFDWFGDAVPLEKVCKISESDLGNIISFLCKLTPEKRRELELQWPEPDTLPTPARFADFVNVEKRATDEECAVAKEADSHMADELAKFNDTSISLLRDALSLFLSKCRNLSASHFSWMRDAVRDVVSDCSSIWHELHRVTHELISGVSDLVALADEVEIEIREPVTATVLLEDARRLKAHMETGGKLGWGPFRPKLVKNFVYVLTTVRVNGCRCRDLSQLQVFVDVLRVRIEFEKTWGFWADRSEKSAGPYSLQLRILTDLCHALEEALSLEDAIRQCRDALGQCRGLPEPTWNDESQVHRMMASCTLALARLAKGRAINDIRKIEVPVAAFLAKSNHHLATSELQDAIRNRDVESFARALSVMQDLEKERLSAKRVEEDLMRIRQLAPKLAADLAQTYRETHWEARIQQIREAWYWAQAKTWLEKYTRKEDAPSLEKRVRQMEDAINTGIAKIASLRAWSFCFSRLKEEHRRHMEAWQQCMRRLGKGTGKYAPRHRREAQTHLNQCREAVPAWVMPLHRIWDTVDPAPGMFDVIIIDEASQCGFEALPLFYMGKRILIVGDDKQISPDAVGLPRDAMLRLMKEFLHDFRFQSSFDVESSLFDHGKLRYGKRHVTLREHFRCMPEIIRFSNDLCYRDTPLIPLRQYGPDRLNPCERVYLKEGYREGSHNQVVNRPEAKAIAQKIAELCRDQRYADKTMGVVVLQGDAQARLIDDELLKLLGAEQMAEQMEKRRLICGNPYSFQGDERDIMFLSMVAAPNERIGPLTKSADERRFNVAVSRARDQVWLFHSVTREDLSPSCLRWKLLEFFEGTKPQTVAGICREELEQRAVQDNRAVIKAPQPFDSWFEVDVALELLRKNFCIKPQFKVAGKRIDLVVEGGQARLAVECDGDEFHGIDQYEQDMQRQRMLERCGWVFFRVRESQFIADTEAALKDLWGMLNERGIHPETRSDSTKGGESPLRPQESMAEMKIEVGDTVEYIYVHDPKTERQALITRGSSNPELGTMNVNTPIAQALLCAHENEEIEVKLPMGSVHLLVKRIKKAK